MLDGSFLGRIKITATYDVSFPTDSVLKEAEYSEVRSLIGPRAAQSVAFDTLQVCSGRHLLQLQEQRVNLDRARLAVIAETDRAAGV